MKKFNTLAAITLFLLMASNANAQNGFDQLIRSSPSDATKLVQTFAEPLFKGFGVGLNSGWNNTAKTKKFLHIDLRILQMWPRYRPPIKVLMSHKSVFQITCRSILPRQRA